MLRSILIILILQFLIFTGACGLKGDLYIPEQEANSATTVPDPVEEADEDPQSKDELIPD